MTISAHSSATWPRSGANARGLGFPRVFVHPGDFTIAAQMKIGKNAERTQEAAAARGRSAGFLSVKQTGSERGEFLWETADYFPRLVNEILGARSCELSRQFHLPPSPPLPPSLSLSLPLVQLLRRNSTAGFAPRGETAKKNESPAYGEPQKRTEQTLKNTQ